MGHLYIMAGGFDKISLVKLGPVTVITYIQHYLIKT